MLLNDERFVAAVEQVRSADDRWTRALEMARSYGISSRRSLIAALMVRAAEHEDPDAAWVAMCNLSAGAVTSVDEPDGAEEREKARNHRRTTYLIGDAFLAPAHRACGLLATKGWGRRLTPSEEREVRRMIATVLAGVRLAS